MSKSGAWETSRVIGAEVHGASVTNHVTFSENQRWIAETKENVRGCRRLPLLRVLVWSAPLEEIWGSNAAWRAHAMPTWFA